MVRTGSFQTITEKGEEEVRDRKRKEGREKERKKRGLLIVKLNNLT